MAANNFRQFLEGIRIAPGFATDPVVGNQGEIYFNTVKNGFRYCALSSPLTWVDVNLLQGTINNSVLRWDQASLSWMENVNLLISGSTISSPNSPTGSTLTLQSGAATAGNTNGGDIDFIAGLGSGSGAQGNVGLTGTRINLNSPTAVITTGLPSDPVSGVSQQVYYNTVQKQFKFYDGTTWRVMGGAGGIVSITVIDTVDLTMPATDATLIDGQTIVDGNLVLFTALSDSSANNRIYKASVAVGNITWTLQILGQDPAGMPTAGDSVFVVAGTLYHTQLWFFNGTSWNVDHTSDVTLGTANGLSLLGQALSLQLSSGSQPGALSSTDWSTFNTGASTAAAALPSASFTSAAVTGKLITGFVSGAGTVSATDTILQAINKLDGNVAGKQPSGSYITALTSDVTASGPGSVAATIAAGAVTLAKMANLAANSIIGNNTGSAATPIALTTTQITAMLNQFTSLLQGAVPASGGGTANFLRADGSWTAPPAGASSLASLTDVALVSPALNNVLSYNGVAWANVVPSFGNAGSGLQFFLDDQVQPVDGYEQLLGAPNTVTGTHTDTISVVGNTVFEQGYLFNSAIGGTQIDSGEWQFDIYADVNSTAAGSVSTVNVDMFDVQIGAGTVTITGSGTSRTATVTGGTPFVAGDANANQRLAGYLQTAGGTFQITALTNTHIVTITTPGGYVNETSVTYTKHLYLFGIDTPALTTTVAQLYSTVTVQPAFILASSNDQLAIRTYGTSTNTRTIRYYHNGTTSYSHFHAPLIQRHNNLAGLQGGSANQYYHLTQAVYTSVNGVTFPASGTLATLAGTETFSGKTISDSLTIAEIATPAAPASGKRKFYVKSDGFFYTEDLNGTEYRIGTNVRGLEPFTNFLTNGNFEQSYNVAFSNPNGWSAPSGPSGQLAIYSSAANVYAGQFSGRWTPTAAAQNLINTAFTITAGGGPSGNGAATCMVRTAGSAHQMQVIDGATVLNTITIPATGGVYVPVSLNFAFPASSTGINLQFISGDTNELALDECFLGDARAVNLSSVSQANWIGSVITPWTTSCAWLAAPAFGSAPTTPAAVSACPVPTPGTNSALSAPATKIPAAVLAGGGKPGVYRLVAKGLFASASASPCVFRFSDGTNNSAMVTTGTGGVVGESAYTPTIEGEIVYSSSVPAGTIFSIQAAGGSNCSISAGQGGSTTGLEISVYYFPTSSQTAVTQDQTDYGWTAYTATPVGFGTPSNLSLMSRRRGENIEIMGSITPGTTTADEARIPLPGSLVSADTSKLTSTITPVGWAVRGAASSTAWNYVPLIEPSTGYLTFGRQTSAESPRTKQTASNMLSSGEVFQFYATFPIQGWISNQGAVVVLNQVSTSAAGGIKTEVALVGTACTSDPCTVTSQTGAFSAINWSSTGVYVAHINAGAFGTMLGCRITSGRNVVAGIDFSTLTATTVNFDTRDTAGTMTNQPFTLECSGLK